LLLVIIAEALSLPKTTQGVPLALHNHQHEAEASRWDASDTINA